MRILKGKPVAPGYGDGRAFVVGRVEPVLPEYAVDRESVAPEQQRFQKALSHAVEELERLSSRVAEDIGRSHAEIFAAHLALLKDPGFVGRINARIERDRINAEQAVRRTVDELARTLAGIDDAYLREREQDIRDLGRWILRHLNPQASMPLGSLLPDSVIVAQEILPSDLLHVDRSRIAAIVTERGGEVSHAVILARSLGIPCVTGVAKATREIAPGSRVLVDGQSGEVWVDPTEAQESDFARRKRRYDEATSIAVRAEDRECVTLDGERIWLFGNIGRAFDVAQVLEHKLDGVGLFRTEYLFLDEPEPPSLPRQRETYRAVAEAMRGRPVVIRTLDLGGDKWPSFVPHHFETNPALGLRGLRFSLTTARDLFRDQLRAIVQAAGDHDVRIQFPMVMGGYDLLQAKALLDEVRREEGISRTFKVGAMIETPSAVFTIHEILDHADFVSIGTNDLIQFILAADRNTLELVDDYTPLHPAVLRAVKQVVDAACVRNCPVIVCGEAAADPGVACILVGLGLRALSMSPGSAARVRQVLRKVSVSNLKHTAESALSCRDPAEIARLVLPFAEIQAP